MIELTPAQIESVAIMLKSGVFEIKNGSVELHFDSLGRLAAVESHQKLFRREKISTVERG